MTGFTFYTNMDITKRKALLQIAIEASLKGGGEIMNVYNSTIEVEYKDDKSPLTQADKNAHYAIIKLLDPTQVPVLSEEGQHLDYAERKDWEYLWVVDPLDGTKEFIKRNGEFTVNIALVKNEEVIMGVIYVPVLKTLYFGLEGMGSYRVNDVNENTSLKLSELVNDAERLPIPTERPFTMVGSRSHMSEETKIYFDEIRKSHPNAEIISKGSSLKICMIAEGSADIYPRFAPTMEWDTAAGHGIVKEAGFEIYKTDIEKPLSYNKADLLNPWFIVKPKVS